MSGRIATRAFLTAALYAVVGRTEVFLPPSIGISPIWPAAGVALAALLLWGRSMGYGVLAGSLLLALSFGMPAHSALFVASGNALGAVCAAKALRARGFNESLGRLRDVLDLLTFGALLSTLISATVGTAGLLLGGLITSADYFATGLVWWFGDAVGILTVAPLILVWHSRVAQPPRRGKASEIALLIAGTIITGISAFGGQLLLGGNHPLLYTVFPLVIWSAIRFRQHGAATITVVISVICFYEVVKGQGPFVAQSLFSSLILLQIFLAVLAITGLILAAMMNERAAVEEEVRAGHTQLQTIADHAAVLIAYCDTEQRYRFVNRRYAERFGLTPQDVQGKRISEIVGEQAYASFKQHIEVALAGLPAEFDVEVSYTEIGPHFMHCAYVPDLSPSGEIRGFVAVISDLTGRRRAELALQDSERRYRQLADALPQIVWTAAADGVVDYHNRRWFEYTGLNGEEPNGGLSVLHADDKQHTLDTWQEALQSGQSFAIEFRLKRASDDTFRWHLSRGVPVRDMWGHAVKWVGTCTDIHEKKLAEKALEDARSELESKVTERTRELTLANEALRDQIAERRRLEAKLLQDAEQLSDIIKTQYDIAAEQLDLQRVMRLIAERAQQLTSASGAAVELLDGDDLVSRTGCGTAAEYVGMRLTSATSLSGLCVRTRSILKCDDVETNPRVDRASRSQMGGRSMIVVPLLDELRAFGVLKVVSPKPYAFNDRDVRTLQLMAGSIAAAVKHTTDFEDRKRIEAELERARDQAFESMKLKSQFLANMSHEIRTPMNGVVGMANLLLDTNLTAEQRGQAEIIQLSGEALLNIINDILDFSKIEAGKMQLEIIDFDLFAEVEATVSLLSERARSKHIGLAAFFAPDVPRAVRGDPGRLRQVLTNLVDNAVKFTTDGEVIIRIGLQAEEIDRALIRFEVIDSGIGIPADAQQLLFQPFTQADGSTTRKYGGTGLGLAICKQLIDLMHGEIRLESTPGEGSTFSFSIPLDLQPIAPEAARRLTGSRILIITQTPGDGETLARLTASYGMIPSQTDNASTGLIMLREATSRHRPFDAVIFDTTLVGMSSDAFVLTVRSEQMFTGTRLIGVTTVADRGKLQALHAAGLDATLARPITQLQLITSLTGDRRGAMDATSAERISGHLADSKQERRQNRSTRGPILVVEDNRVNQIVVMEQLKRLGFRADSVANGLEAVEAVTRIPYALVLMDCLMPEMDGFSATAEIRRRHDGKTYVPIIAMTANAMKGDRERCLAAGMDDYVSKPISLKELSAVLDRWLSRTESSHRVHGDQPQVKPAFDPEKVSAVLHSLHDEFGHEMVLTLIDTFITDTQQRMAGLETAIDSGNSEDVMRAAHSIKGNYRNIGAGEMERSCSILENQAKSGSLNSAHSIAELLRDSNPELIAFLETKRAEYTVSAS